MIDFTISVHILRQIIDAVMQTVLDKGVRRLEFEFLITCFSSLGLSLPPLHRPSSCQKEGVPTKSSDDLMILPIIAVDVPKSCFITKPPSLQEQKKKKKALDLLSLSRSLRSTVSPATNGGHVWLQYPRKILAEAVQSAKCPHPTPRQSPLKPVTHLPPFRC